ncbi:MAG: YbhB/YbcL family Raf kinase inhibitor-like protein [Acidobacteria bacterium]|nr:MAG: YbhB/YbcL family Raf kinase inhibitor-like protein [Acidobacteriota bacterium]
MRLSSAAFAEGGMLPPRFTCDGDGVSPPLAWADVPDGTQGFALLCEDPDAPSGMFTHWLLYNLSAGSRELAEDIPKDAVLSIGARQGTNSFGDLGYGGACPPRGDREHRYIFKLYALDTDLALEPGVRREQLLDAIRDRVLAEAQLMGKYKR